MMKRWECKVAVVTGASSGIGKAIAENLVRSGLKVVGLARRKEELDKLAQRLLKSKGEFYPLKADITNEDDVLTAFKWISNNVGIVHILVNNAGIGRTGNLIDGDTKLWKEVLDTNVLGLCIATREAIKIMRVNKVDGHIIHINSIAGHYIPSLPYMNIYPASKHGVTALTETLRQELNSIGSTIKVTSISPGVVDSEFVHSRGDSEEIMKAIESIPSLKPEDIAQAAMYVLGTPPHVQIQELIIKPMGETA